MNLELLKKNPFYLSDDDIKWVTTTIDSMSIEEKIGQLFCMVTYEDNEEYLTNLIHTYKPSGVMLRPMEIEEGVSAVTIMQKASNIPLLISCNLEKGGNGVATSGTSFGSQMLVAATDNIETASKLGSVCGREGKAVGVNWSFAPIIDIDYNFRNPITNTRTLGSNPKRVSAMGRAYVEALQSEGLAASIKHFPGDGCDERDQHLVTSINDLSCDEWDRTFGKIYQENIDAGALTVMVGHIMQPEYSRKLAPGIKDEDIMPATLSKELLHGLLRGKLGFNGMIVSDATTMAGMTIAMPRQLAVPYCIEAGCDMFLFTRNTDEDFEAMKLGIEKGILSEERLYEALIRILGLKASLGLHNDSGKVKRFPSLEEALLVVGKEEHRKWARECAKQGITLVKEEEGVLPLAVNKNKRVLLYGIESDLGHFYSVRGNMPEKIKGLLETEGFEVDIYEPSPGTEGMTEPSTKITKNYDLLIYIANMATKSNQTTVRIEWAQPMGANTPMYVHSVPTIFISLENPYHLLDVPRVRTYINTYASTDEVIHELIDKLMGRSTFKGISPSDPFCGKWDTRLK